MPPNGRNYTIKTKLDIIRSYWKELPALEKNMISAETLFVGGSR
jgi:hypothetical protein